MRAQATMLAVILATAGCTTKFDPDEDATTDATPDSTDTIAEEEIEIPEGCGNGEVEEGEECEGEAAEDCWTECGLEGMHECNPLTCHWEQCLAPENCRNDCDDDGDGWEDCSDLDDCADHPDCEGCADDDYEPNDGQDSASAWAPGTDFDLFMCPGNEDWFGGMLSMGDRIVIDAMFSHAEGNIDMDLIGPDGSTLDYSATITDDESIDFTADRSGNFYLAVAMSEDLGSVTGNAYGLMFDITGSSCDDDLFEENDSLPAARMITRGTHPGLMLCPGDDDYYSATYSSSTTTATIRVDFTHAEGNIDLYLLDGSGGELASSISTTDEESITWSLAPGDTTLYFRITLATDGGGFPGNAYDLDL